MSGLLRQLGRQALGHAAELRPAERLRSASTDWKKFSTDTNAGVAEAETVVSPLPPERAREPGDVANIENVALESAKVIHAKEPDAAHEPRTHPVSSPVKTTTTAEARAVPASPLARETSVAPVNDTSHVVEESLHMTIVENRTTTADRHADREHEPFARPVAQPRAPTEPLPVRRTHDHSVRHRVESERAQSAPPDVHIHIGRIELTAVATPSPARRERPAATKPAMSLDEYLQLRNRKTS